MYVFDSINIYVFLFISSPYMFVFGDGRVIYHTGADDIIGDAVDV